jgi:hypothetical protein
VPVPRRALTPNFELYALQTHPYDSSYEAPTDDPKPRLRDSNRE